MAEIPGVPMPKPNPLKGKQVKRRTTSRSWIDSGPLAPWMLDYGRWIAMNPEAELSVEGSNARLSGPSVAERTRYVNSRTAKRISWSQALRVLERREDFRAYVAKLREDLAFRAREMLAEDVATNIEARRRGLAAAEAAGDHREIRGYSQWAVDLAFPRVQKSEQQPQRVTIIVGGAVTQAAINRALGEPEPITDIEYEIVEPPQLEAGDPEG